MEDENPYDAPPPQDDSPHPQEEKSQGDGSSALINKEAWPDAEPGQIMTFRCVRVLENEIEVMPENGKKEEGTQEEMPPEPANEQDSMMA